MKQILISADGPFLVLSVPDDVSDQLSKYVKHFYQTWLPNSKDAKPYRTDVGFRFDGYTFLEYLNLRHKTSELVETLETGDPRKLPEQYQGLKMHMF